MLFAFTKWAGSERGRLMYGGAAEQKCNRYNRTFHITYNALLFGTFLFWTDFKTINHPWSKLDLLCPPPDRSFSAVALPRSLLFHHRCLSLIKSKQKKWKEKKQKKKSIGMSWLMFSVSASLHESCRRFWIIYPCRQWRALVTSGVIYFPSLLLFTQMLDVSQTDSNADGALQQRLQNNTPPTRPGDKQLQPHCTRLTPQQELLW